MSRKFKKAIDILYNLGYDTNKIHYCFLVCPIQQNKPCIYYWGEFTEINPLCSRDNIINNYVSSLRIPTSDCDLKKYKIFGIHEWKYIKEFINKNNLK